MFLNELEKELLKNFRFYDVKGAIKGWLYYDIEGDVSPLLEESRFFREVFIYSSILNRKVRGLSLDSGLLTEEILEHLRRDADLTHRDLGIPLLYWKREIVR